MSGTERSGKRHSGSCLCGRVTFEIDRTHLGAINCYCQMCRRAHGGPFSTHVALRREQFTLISGRLSVFASSELGRREFCPHCGSHVLVHGQTADSTVAVPAGLLEAAAPIEITSHIFVKDKADWFEIRDDLPCYDGWPPDVAFTHTEDA